MNQEPIQPPPVTTEPVIPPTPPARKFSPVFIFAVLVLLLAVGASGLILGKSLSGSKSSAGIKTVISPIPSQILTPTWTPNYHSDWITFRSNEGKFEFQYPEDFQISSEKKQSFINSIPLVELKSEVSKNLGAIFSISVKSNAKSECEYVPRGAENQSSRAIGGIPFTSFWTKSDSDNLISRNYNINHYYRNDACYEIVIQIYYKSSDYIKDGKHEEPSSGYAVEFDEILSTFKFLQ